jgi:hypothetical protein
MVSLLVFLFMHLINHTYITGVLNRCYINYILYFNHSCMLPLWTPFYLNLHITYFIWILGNTLKWLFGTRHLLICCLYVSYSYIHCALVFIISPKNSVHNLSYWSLKIVCMIHFLCHMYSMYVLYTPQYCISLLYILNMYVYFNWFKLRTFLKYSL